MDKLARVLGAYRASSWLVVAVMMAALCACAFNPPRVAADNLRTAPDVVGKSVGQAQLELESQGFFLVVDPTPSPPPNFDVTKCRTGTVVQQDPPGGTRVVKATTFRLTVENCPGAS